MSVFFAKDHETSFFAPPNCDDYDFDHILCTVPTQIEVKARPDAPLRECLREAFILMCIRKQNVHLTYKDHSYALRYLGLLQMIENYCERQ